MAAAAWLVFRGTLGGGFLQWDDDINVVNNPHVHALGWANLRWMFTDAQYMRRYLPLGWLRWAADYAAFGPDPRPFHFGNLLFHAADAVLLFAAIRALLRRRAARSAGLEVCAALGALSWAVHPLRAEAVAWISTGQYCQAVCFLLLSFLAYLAAADRPRARGLRAAALAAFAASLLSYPAALGYPAALLALDAWVLGRCRDRAGWKRALWEKAPYALVTALVLAATLASRYGARGIWTPPPTLAQFGLGARLMQAAYVWAYFLWKPLFPFHLAPVYTALVDFDPLAWPFLASAALVLGLTALLLWRRRRWPAALGAWLCHLALLVPMLGLTEHPHYASDRYVYLASLVWSAALGGALLRLWPRRPLRLAALGAAAVLLALAARASAAQARIWHDSETLFQAALARLGPDPYRYDILLRLGRLRESEGRLPQAEAAFRQALAARPDEAEAKGRLGLVLFEQGRAAEAEAYLGPAARLGRESADAQAALIAGFLRSGLGGEALEFARAAARLQPDSPGARENLALAEKALARPAEPAR
ncbi:MAG TPA: tetratricopeptide repeat protein [Opitutaceae bacterium]|nr:tetratricopeptide repeat protein [Opitutaceae bacterium]